MKDLPNPFWAALFIAMGVILAVVALYSRSAAGVIMAVVTIASNIVSGSFGYISGHKDGAASVSVPSQPSPTSATVVSVGSTVAGPANSATSQIGGTP